MHAIAILSSMLLPTLAVAEGMAKIKINLPDLSTYRDYYNYDDFVWGGDSKEIEFSQIQIMDEFAIKFKWITWVDNGGDYTHGSSVWNMNCYAQSTATYIGTAEWTLCQDGENPITGTANSPGRVWCPADQGECEDALRRCGLALAGDSIQVKINLPPTGEYRDWENSADYKGGGDTKVHTFNRQQIQDDFAIKFHYTVWEPMEDGQDYRHGSKRWDMTCYVKATDTTDTLIPEFTLTDVLKKPIEVNVGGPAILWCPADQGTCIKKDCQVPNIDSTAA